MSHKNGRIDILKNLHAEVDDFDLQAGSRGMAISEIAKRYLKSPGHFLALLRFFREETLEKVSNGTEIPIRTLEAYEKGTTAPSLKDLSTIAKYFDADLRVVLEVFGHVTQGASSEGLGLAADFSGSLQEDEKVTMKELVKRFSRS